MRRGEDGLQLADIEVKVRGLNGRCDPEVGKAFHVLGVQELGAFYAVVGMPLGGGDAGLFERIQYFLVRPVAYGVAPYPQAVLVCLAKSVCQPVHGFVGVVAMVAGCSWPWLFHVRSPGTQ